MKRFIVYYKVGQSVRECRIEAEDLEDAVNKCEERYPNWTDVYCSSYEKSY